MCITLDTLCAQLLLQFYTDQFETLQALLVCGYACGFDIISNLIFVPFYVPRLPKGEGEILFLGGSRWCQHWHQCRCRRKTSCPLCNLNTLWNILMILGRNVETGPDNVSLTRMTILPFLLLELSPFVLFEKDFMSALLLKYPLEYFYGTWQKCRAGPDDMLHIRMTTLTFLLLTLSPFVMSDTDYPLILCLLWKSKTLWNIFMILGGNVEQTRWHVAYKNDNSAFLTFGIISLCYIWQW